MGGGFRTGLVRTVAVALLFVVILTGTAVADSLVPEVRRGGAGEEIGRAGFAYLTGIRSFAAAVLWNRLDPLFHDYYGDLSLTEQTYMLPTIRMAITLDPQLQQPYYVAAWMLTQRGDVEEGVELARLGTENNPRSGLLRANYAQILWLVLGDVETAAEQSGLALAEETEWYDVREKHDAYVVFRDVFRAAGDEARASEVTAEIQRIDTEMDDLDIDHDHDH